MDPQPPDKPPPPKSSVVYLIHHPGGFVKIGKSTNVARRLSDIQINSPLPLTLVGTIPTADDLAASILERSFHEQFAHLRVSGEWFTEHSDIYSAMGISPPLKSPQRSPGRLPIPHALLEAFQTYATHKPRLR